MLIVDRILVLEYGRHCFYYLLSKKIVRNPHLQKYSMICAIRSYFCNFGKFTVFVDMDMSAKVFSYCLSRSETCVRIDLSMIMEVFYACDIFVNLMMRRTNRINVSFLYTMLISHCFIVKTMEVQLLV